MAPEAVEEGADVRRVVQAPVLVEGALPGLRQIPPPPPPAPRDDWAGDGGAVGEGADG